MDSTPGTDANVDVPSSINMSLDASLTPKAESLCGTDVCSTTLMEATTLMEETTDAVVPNGDGIVDDLKPLSPLSDENHGGCANNADEQTIDVPDDQFFPASEGTARFFIFTVFYILTSELREKIWSTAIPACS